MGCLPPRLPRASSPPPRQLGRCKDSEWRGRPGEEKGRREKGVKSAKSDFEEKGEKVKRRDAVPGGHGGTSEQADAASGPVPKHPGPDPSLIFLFIWFGPAPRSIIFLLLIPHLV